MRIHPFKIYPKFLNWMVQKTAKAVIIFQFSCTNTRINSGVDIIELTQRNRFNGFVTIQVWLFQKPLKRLFGLQC